MNGAGEIILEDEQATRRLGALLAQRLVPRAICALIGTLGAGKTRLVQAVAEALGISPESVHSPTFVLLQSYQGRFDGQPITLHHMDWYRVGDPDELFELGVEDLFESPGLVWIEWADRFTEALPPHAIRIEIDVLGPTRRRVRWSAACEDEARRMEEVQQRWQKREETTR